MKIIVCGAGSVGRSIVAYLSRGSNDIIVIDTDFTNSTKYPRNGTFSR